MRDWLAKRGVLGGENMLGRLINRLRTGNPQLRASPLTNVVPFLKQVRDYAEETATKAHRLEIELRHLRDEFEQLRGQHDKLRNKFYGTLGGRPEKERVSGLDSIPVGDKAALRKHFGVVPSKQE
jgi:hypothetical protein